MDEIEKLELNKIYTNNEIADIFKCSTSGGMKKSKRTNSLVLVAKHGDSSYEDSWTDDNILYYTGMGLTGDQDINFRYNKDLAFSNETDIKVYLFESFVDNEYYYRGEVYLCGEIFSVMEPDIEGNMRKVYKFPLKPKREQKEFLVNEESLKMNEKLQSKEVRKISKEEIKKRAKNNHAKKVTRKVVSTYRNRNVYVAEHTKNRAKGKCDLCHEDAPFKRKNGEEYLEEHHVITLANDGPDTIYNTVALCPNCHKKIHVLNRKSDVDSLKRAIFNYLKIDNDEENLKKFSDLFPEYKLINK